MGTGAKKRFMGVRLRRLREERGMNQQTLARALALSPSYLNQLENDQRPLTMPVLLKLHSALGVDIHAFSEDEEALMLSGLREALADGAATDPVSLAELRELAANMPAVGRNVMALHRRLRDAQARLDVMGAQLGEDRDPAGNGPPDTQSLPYEEVRDFFFTRHNHFDELDRAAEAMATTLGLALGAPETGLECALQERHGVRIVRTAPPAQPGVHTDGSAVLHRRFDAAQRLLEMPLHLEPGQHAFQMATQFALLEMGPMIDRLTAAAGFSHPTARPLARIGLANYFAGALLLPYGRFLAQAEALRYDIELLARHFGAGFEMVCHRLSTLQRPDARGVPFFFIRVDRAGNVSKRQSATHFHFSKSGGTCPLWNVYEAFAQPGRIIPQLARMPDGRAYLWVARTVSRAHGGYAAATKTFSVALGCDIRHAPRVVYSKGLDLQDPEVPVPIGMGCKVCEREACPQRAFPYVGRPLQVDESRSGFVPYPTAPVRSAP